MAQHDNEHAHAWTCSDTLAQALRGFGLTLLFGIGLVWLISPLFRPSPEPHPVNGNPPA